MAISKISIEEVKRIINMCNLDVLGMEEKFSSILSDTLSYLAVLDEIPLENVSETYQVTGLTNIFQQKDNSKTLSQKEALSNAKESVDGLIATKAVFER